MRITNTHYKKLTQLAERIEAVPSEHFNMSSYFIDHHTGAGLSWEARAEGPAKVVHNCGTAACIAGYALALFAPEPVPGWWNMGDQAQRALDLTREVCEDLFTPKGYLNHEVSGTKLARASSKEGKAQRAAKALFTPANAAKAVRELRDTGKVPAWWSSTVQDV